MSIEILAPPAVAAHAGRPSATLGEAAVVLGLPIGVFAARELSRLLTNGRVQMRPAFSDTRLLATLGVEVLLGAVLIWWLRRRGWQPAVSLGRPALADVPRGTVLWIATFAVTTLLSLAVSVVAPALHDAANAAELRGTLSWGTYLVALLVNPLFEEALWLGYAIPTLERTIGTRAAAMVSVFLRLGVHYNQGALALTSILPVGIVWTSYFLWRRRLWPVVVAHVINNAIGLSAFLIAGD